jgi:hypothetical protein
LGELVLGNRHKTKCLVETDELQGGVHIQHLMPACIYQGLDNRLARPLPRNSSSVKTPSTSCPSL